MYCARPLLLVTSLALGCGLYGDGSHFYMLSVAAGAPLARHPLRVGLGPVVVPAYLDAPTIATRVDPNRIEYARFDRWAVPLAAEVRRVLAEDLGAAGTISVVPYSWYSSTALDAVVRVTTKLVVSCKGIVVIGCERPQLRRPRVFQQYYDRRPG